MSNILIHFHDELVCTLLTPEITRMMWGYRDGFVYLLTL